MLNTVLYHCYKIAIDKKLRVRICSRSRDPRWIISAQDKRKKIGDKTAIDGATYRDISHGVVARKLKSGVGGSR